MRVWPQRLDWSLRSLDRVIAELKTHDALDSETAYSGGSRRTWYRLTRLDAVPFSRVPLWLAGEVSARAVRTYAALDTFMDYREPALSKVIPSDQVAERLGCSTRTFWRGVAALKAAGVVQVSPQRGASHYQTASGFTLHPDQTARYDTARLPDMTQLSLPPSPPSRLKESDSERGVKKTHAGEGVGAPNSPTSRTPRPDNPAPD